MVICKSRGASTHLKGYLQALPATHPTTYIKATLKNSYPIRVWSGLLTPKHYYKMKDHSVRVYLLFLDWITKEVDGEGIVLGGKPITHELVKERLPISRTKYSRCIKNLLDEGYIQTKRQSQGVSISILKSKKRCDVLKMIQHLKSDVTKSTHQDKSDVTKTDIRCNEINTSDVTKSTHPYIKDDNTVDNTVDNNIPPIISDVTKSTHPLPETDLSEKIDNYASIKELVIRFYEFQYQQYPKQLHAWKKKPAVLESEGIIEIDRIIRLDGYTLEDIKNTLQFAVSDYDFWSDKIQSLKGLRKKKPNGNTKFTNVFNDMNRGKKDLLDPVREWLKSENEGNYATG